MSRHVIARRSCLHMPIAVRSQLYLLAHVLSHLWLCDLRACDPLSMNGVERRNELPEYDVSYCVYGSFRECDGDEGFRDTRWLTLNDLLSAFEWDFLEQHIILYEKTFVNFREQSFQLLREQLSSDEPRNAQGSDGVRSED